MVHKTLGQLEFFFENEQELERNIKIVVYNKKSKAILQF